MTSSKNNEYAPLKELQSTGFAEIKETIYKTSTLDELRKWVFAKVVQSEKTNKDFIFQYDSVYLPVQANYSSLRNNVENTHINLSQYSCIVKKRIHNNQGIGDLFIDLIGLGSFNKTLEIELTGSNLYKQLSYIYNIRSSDIEFHVYATKNCTQPRGWHLDGSSLKLFTYLSDVNLNHGPYAYQLGSHRHYCTSFTEQSQSYFRADDKARVSNKFYNKRDVLICTGKYGTSFLSDQSGIHRGLPQALGSERYVLVAQFKL